MEMHMGLNTFDYVVIGTVLLSAITALFSGFVSEVLSLVKWSIAYWIAVRFSYVLKPLVLKYVKSASAAEDIAIIGMFGLAFILLTIVCDLLVKQIQKSPLTGIDRTLGFIFGVLRGALIVSLFYMVFTYVMWPDLDKTPTHTANTEQAEAQPEKPPAPAWLMQAKTRPWVAKGSAFLKGFIPFDIVEKTTSEYMQKKSDATRMIEQGDLDTLSVPAIANPSITPAR
ncbi:MAG: CvpA family protein [Alphaproteobacteria bacterium]|nr:CvpA family protein [Alphaproteobacteria bacterium]MBV8548380.1 CvpA family protein [Alphaproteobacteria bacterium]